MPRLGLQFIILALFISAGCGSDAPTVATPVADATMVPEPDVKPPSDTQASPEQQDAAPVSDQGPVTPDTIPADDTLISDAALFDAGADLPMSPSDAQEPNTPDGSVDTGGPAPEPSDPGRITLHRLNRVEYNNTVQDLLGTTQTPADDFPNDDHGYGFDNIADVLAVSPLLFELYERAADSLVSEALFEPVSDPIDIIVEAEEAQTSSGGANGTEAWTLWSNGSATELMELPAAGTYRFSASVWGQQAGPELVRMGFLANGLSVGEVEVSAIGGNFTTYEVEVSLEGGLTEIGVAFLNDYYEPDTGEDRNLIVDWFQLYGPLEFLSDPPYNPQREAIVLCTPEDDASPYTECLSQNFEAFGRRAWRRPLSSTELSDLVAFSDVVEAEGEGFEAALRLGIKAMLVSPHFLFRVELDPDPSDLTPHPLSDHELASRLSYFMWSSMPDDELLAAADAGLLSAPGELEAQARRMFQDPRSRVLVDHFAGQWLYLRALEDVAPDPWVHPEWDEALRESMNAEAWLFVNSILRGDRSMRELLTAPTSFIDGRLAEHYGITGYSPPPGGGFVEMDVSPWNRGGFLRQGSILTSSSFATRTSPVKRGKWVLSELLCNEPPPPPPGVEGITDEALEGATIREIMEQHRSDPTCAACHNTMDPIGLSFEHYDSTGRWRTHYANGAEVDASGELPGAIPIAGLDDFIDVLVDLPDFSACITEKLFTYALGRGPMAGDFPVRDALTEAFIASGYRFEQLIVDLVLSEPFRMRRGEAEEDSP